MALPPEEVAFRDEEWRVPTELLKAIITARLIGPPHVAPRLGHFELVRELGHGGAGAVYEARDLRNQNVVALKLLRKNGVGAIHAFKREFRGLTHVVHENLVRLHELFCDGEHWYFTMELVRGVSFTSYARGLGHGLSYDRARLIPALVQLLSAVQAIHVARKLHCDLKPSNVLVTDSGRVVVLDFGLSRPQNSSARRTREGTPLYMAPELAAGQTWSEASDAYAIGVILFMALSGGQPFADASASDAIASARMREALSEATVVLREMCERLLAQDPSARMTIEQALALLRTSATPPRATANPTPSEKFVGRERELGELRAAYADVRAEGPIAVFVRGCSGIGKSALATRFERELRSDAHTIVLNSACHERESLPYKAFDGLVDELAEQLASMPRIDLGFSPQQAAALLKMFPSLGSYLSCEIAASVELRSSWPEQRQLAFAAFKQLLQRLSQRYALVLIADDLQWADLDSARLLLELLGPPAAPALLYVGCYRSEEETRSEFLRALLAEDASQAWQATRRLIDLEPFDPALARAMSMALLTEHVAAPELVATRIARESGGIPFFVRELVSYFVNHVGTDETQLSVSELLAARVTALTVNERLALELLSLAGRPMGEQVLSHACRHGQACSDDLRVLAVQGLVNADAQSHLVVYHDRLRELIVQRIAKDRVASLHRLLAQAYEEADSVEPEWLIEHWRAAGEPLRALEYALTAAAAAAGKLAFNRAAELYGTALELHPGHGHDTLRREIYVAHAEVLVHAGRGAHAANAFLAAADGAEADVAYALRCREAQQLLRSGRGAQAAELLQRLWREIGMRYPESLAETTWMLLTTRARIGLRERLPWLNGRDKSLRTRRIVQVLGAAFREFAVSDPMRGMLFRSMFYENAVRTGDPESVFIGYAWDTIDRAFLSGQRKRGRIAAQLDQLDAFAQRLDTAYAYGTAMFARGVTAFSQGEYTLAATLTEQAKTIFREQCLGTVWEETMCVLWQFAALENVGPLSALSREAPALARRADEHKDDVAAAILCPFMVGVLLVDDRPADAMEFLNRRTASNPNNLGFSLFGYRMRLIDTLIYLGQGARAWEACEEFWPTYMRSGYNRVDAFCIIAHMRRGHAALAANAARKDRSLDHIVRHSAASLDKLGRLEASALAASLLAALAFQRGKLEDARQRMSRALALVERVGVPVAEQCFRLQLGRLSTGPEGARMTAQAESALRAFGVVAPTTWVETCVTVFAGT